MRAQRARRTAGSSASRTLQRIHKQRRVAQRPRPGLLPRAAVLRPDHAQHLERAFGGGVRHDLPGDSLDPGIVALQSQVGQEGQLVDGVAGGLVAVQGATGQALSSRISERSADRRAPPAGRGSRPARNASRPTAAPSPPSARRPGLPAANPRSLPWALLRPRACAARGPVWGLGYPARTSPTSSTSSGTPSMTPGRTSASASNARGTLRRTSTTRAISSWRRPPRCRSPTPTPTTLAFCINSAACASRTAWARASSGVASLIAPPPAHSAPPRSGLCSVTWSEPAKSSPTARVPPASTSTEPEIRPAATWPK